MSPGRRSGLPSTICGSTESRIDGCRPSEEHISEGRWRSREILARPWRSGTAPREINPSSCGSLPRRWSRSSPSRSMRERIGSRGRTCRPSVVFHGSSITHGVGLDTATEAWPAIFAHDLQASLLNLGWAGSCLISGLASRMVRDQAASLIALELGINVHADGLLKERTFLSSVHSFIAIVREGHPTTPIAIVSPIFCEAAEDTALGDGLSLSRMRSLLAEAVETGRGAGDGRIQLISGLDLLGPADAADLPDGLHPSRNGHAKIASRFRTKAASVGLLDHLPVPGVE